MRERGDFPAMAGTVGQISELTSSEAHVHQRPRGNSPAGLPGSAFVHGLGEWRIEALVSKALGLFYIDGDAAGTRLLTRRC
jgi:hypothetical protein